MSDASVEALRLDVANAALVDDERMLAVDLLLHRGASPERTLSR